MLVKKVCFYGLGLVLLLVLLRHTTCTRLHREARAVTYYSEFLRMRRYSPVTRSIVSSSKLPARSRRSFSCK